MGYSKFSILIVNAYSEEEMNEALANETLDLGNLSNDADNSNVGIASGEGKIENIKNNENSGKTVTASFGVYLEIVG